ncbi:hypothetical protein GGI07_005855, partial [Coemansia sp. Benny D115]
TIPSTLSMHGNVPKPDQGPRLSMGSRAHSGPKPRHHGSPRAASRSREYEGFFPRHPSRGNSDASSSISVTVPDMPSPLSAAPSALAFKHDRRRDYFIDTTTFAAATGKCSAESAGITYDIRERSSVEPTDAPLRSTSLAKTPTILQVGLSGNDARRASHSSIHRGNGSEVPFFRRTGSDQATGSKKHGEYGAGSRLPRFMLDRLRKQEAAGTISSGGADGTGVDSSRASVASGASNELSAGIHSPASSTSTSAMQTMLEIEEAKLLSAERKTQLRAVDSILSEEQKIAYVGLVYVLLVDIHDRLNVQYKESQSSTASYMNYSRRLMRKMYSHIHLNAEEQRMVELLPRHKITAADMALSLAAQGDTILVEADQDLAVMHSQAEAELIQALRSSSECRSSSESQRQSKSRWQLLRRNDKSKEDDLYSQYSMLPSETLDPDAEETPEPASGGEGINSFSASDSDSETEFTSPTQHRTSVTTATARSANRDISLAHPATDTEPESDANADAVTQEPLNSRSDQEPLKAAGKRTSSATETAQPLEDVALTKVDAEQPLAIDVRATLILDMFLLLLSDEVYDSRGRYLLRRLAEALNYPWSEVMRCERRVTQQLSLHDYAVDVTSATKNTADLAIKERASKGKTRRMVIIGLATVGGGLVIGLSAGLLAPAIGAGIGATLGAIGVANTGAFFGSIGGTALITSAATLTGSGLAGRQITRRTRFAEQFEFIPCINERQTNLVLTVPGWLGKADNGVFAFSTLDPLNGDHCSLLWESDSLRRLGSSLRMIVGEVFSITLTQTLQHTVLPSLLGPLSIPMWLAKLGYVLDNPWSNGCDLATSAGPVVADLLLQRVQGQRPVTLIGYSIGARLIFYMLIELAKMNAFGLVEDVYLFGAPVIASEEEWRMAASVVGGRFVNAYSTKDWILGFFYRTTNIGRKSIAGMHPITGVNGLENVDVSSEVPGHNAYREVIPLLLQNMGVSVTSTELHDPNENPGESDDDRAMINELEKAAEMLEEHEKKKKKIWPHRWSFWDTSTSPKDESLCSTSKASEPSTSVDPTSSPASVSASASASASATAALAAVAHGPTAQNEVDSAARELAELGIQIKEVPTTLPTLIIGNEPVPYNERSKESPHAST